MLLKKFNFHLFLISILAFIIRLRGFDTHYLLSSDTARDILTAKGAVLLHQLPWVGSFSSGGPFVFGPNWYWQLMLPQILFPNLYLGPWFLMFVISLLFVVVMGLCGRLLGGKRLGLFVALLTAISPAVIGFSAYATQHAMVEIFSALTLLGFLAFLKTRRLLFAFLMAVSIGGAISYHYQALNLLVYFPVVLGIYFWKTRSVKLILKLFLVWIFGFGIFLVPLLLWDASRGFANTLHLIGYFKVGQYQIYIPNSWRIYLFSFWPDFMGKMVGGNFQLGIFFGVFTSLVVVAQFFRRKISPVFLGLLAVFGMQFLMMRYFRGERFDGYLVYFHPIVLILVAYAITSFARINKAVIFLLMAGLTVISTWLIMPILDWNNDNKKLENVVLVVKNNFPGQKFSVYGRSPASFNLDYSLSLLFEGLQIGDDSGHPIGICLYEIANCSTKGVVEIAKGEFQGQPFVVADLSGVKKEDLTKKNDWYPFSAVAVYDDVQNWWKKGL